MGSFWELTGREECFLKALLVADRAQGLREWSEQHCMYLPLCMSRLQCGAMSGIAST